LPKIIEGVLCYTVQEVAAQGPSPSAILQLLRKGVAHKRVLDTNELGARCHRILIPQKSAMYLLKTIKVYKRDPVKEPPKKRKPKGLAKRECLRCGKMFMSEHKANRICKSCKEINARHYALAGVIFSLQEPK
jgi:formylmethanofuran dehydrogenase subunit E